MGGQRQQTAFVFWTESLCHFGPAGGLEDFPGKLPQLSLPPVCLGPTAPCSPRRSVIDMSKRVLCVECSDADNLVPSWADSLFCKPPPPAPPDTHTSLLFSHSASLHLNVCLPSASCTRTSHWPRVLCSGIPVCSAVFGARVLCSGIATDCSLLALEFLSNFHTHTPEHLCPLPALGGAMGFFFPLIQQPLLQCT